jgi:hypothetical protein
MRLSIFIGLIYIAWSINPTEFDKLGGNSADLILIGVVFWMAVFGDVKDLLKNNK